MKGEGRLGEAKMSLIYVLQCCLQIRMGSFNMSAALFPRNFKGEGWKGLGQGGGVTWGGGLILVFLLGFSFSFLQSTFTLSRSQCWTLSPFPPPQSPTL